MLGSMVDKLVVKILRPRSLKRIKFKRSLKTRQNKRPHRPSCRKREMGRNLYLLVTLAILNHMPVSLKRFFEEKDFIKNATNCPDVDFVAISRIYRSDQLWGTITFGSSPEVCGLGSFGAPLHRKTEVGNFPRFLFPRV